MNRGCTIEPARPADRLEAFRLAFHHLAVEDREARVANALELVERGELDPAGIWVARDREAVRGVLLCLIVPGASALIWPPRTVPASAAIEDALVRRASDWLKEKGAKLAQALLAPAEAHLAGPLERNGFRHITSLCYLRHHLDLPADLPSLSLTWQAYPECVQLYHQTLLRTYEETRDCPEVNGIRSIDEIIAGHQAQGKYDPGRWWLALHENRPAGVLLLTELPEQHNWEVSYVGVVPELRGLGLGRQLMHKAFSEARAGKAAALTLSVDARNLPACNLYRSLGFQTCESREVFLAIWKK